MRYFKLFGIFFLTALAARMEYRANFLIALVIVSLESLGMLLGLYLFYQNGYDLGGWRWQEALAVMGSARFLEGVFVSWLNPNLQRISERVQEGTLDFVLLKPVDSQFWVSTESFTVWGLPSFLVAGLLLGYASVTVGLELPYLLLALALASLLFYSLAFTLATTTIWFVKLYNVVNVLGAVLWNAQYPVTAYDRPFRLFMTYVLPVYFMTTVPAELALGRKGPEILIPLGLLALALFLFSRAFWRFALRSYGSASS